MYRHVWKIFLGAVFWQGAVIGQETGFVDTLDIQVLVNTALQNNPQLHAMRHEAEAKKAQIQQATSWEAPQVGVEFYQTPISSFPIPTKKNMETDYFIQQMFPCVFGVTECFT